MKMYALISIVMCISISQMKAPPKPLLTRISPALGKVEKSGLRSPVTCSDLFDLETLEGELEELAVSPTPPTSPQNGRFRTPFEETHDNEEIVLSEEEKAELRREQRVLRGKRSQIFRLIRGLQLSQQRSNSTPALGKREREDGKDTDSPETKRTRSVDPSGEN